MRARANIFWRFSVRAIGPVWRNCGASAAQEQLGAEQAQFYSTLTDAFKQTFPEQQSILSTLTNEFTPILQAGPNQEGFSAPELAALRTQASDSTAEGAQQADVALGAKMAANGDGTIPSGAKSQEEESLLSGAASETSKLQTGITEADYSAGHDNFLKAAEALGSTASLQNPNGSASAATGAGSAANTTQNDIAKENSAWMGPVFGLLGGLGGSFIANDT